MSGVLSPEAIMREIVPSMGLARALILIGTVSVVSAAVRTERCRAFLLCMIADKRLTGHILTVTKMAASPIDCAQQCLGHVGCMSINHKSDGLCEINKSDKNSHNADFVSAPGFTYYGEDVCMNMYPGKLCGQDPVTPSPAPASTTSTTTSAPVVCTSPMENTGGRCLQFKNLNFVSLTWADTKQNCEKDNYRLPLIKDELFYSAVVAAAVKKGYGKVWTSYTYDTTSKTWRWPDGNGFTKWAAGQSTADTNQCAILNTATDGFEKVDCAQSKTQYVICEQP